MVKNSIPVYGKDAEGHKKRAFDWVTENGETFMETKIGATKIRTPAREAIIAYKQLQENKTDTMPA